MKSASSVVSAGIGRAAARCGASRLKCLCYVALAALVMISRRQGDRSANCTDIAYMMATN